MEFFDSQELLGGTVTRIERRRGYYYLAVEVDSTEVIRAVCRVRTSTRLEVGDSVWWAEGLAYLTRDRLCEDRLLGRASVWILRR